MQKKVFLILALLGFSVLFAGGAWAQEEELFEATAVKRQGGWRLPFAGTKDITDGPLEDRHTGRSAEAIDYFAGGASFEILAPQNGVITDISLVGDRPQDGFGNVIVIRHGEDAAPIYSFYAHLADNPPGFVGKVIKQGKPVAWTGSTGDGGANNHLHFEARTAMTQGNINTGNASPIRSLPGNWWQPFYSPPPDFQHDPAKHSGKAQYPENATRPSGMAATARHLSNQVVPTAAPAGWSSNLSSNALMLHFGAAPHTPLTDIYATFNVYTLAFGSSIWSQPSGGSATVAASRSFATNGSTAYNSWGIHIYRANATSIQNPSCNAPTCFRYWVLDGANAGGGPGISANFRSDTANTTLEFCHPGANKYKVYKAEPGDTSFVKIYAGPGCSIMVERPLGGNIEYYADARVPNVGWFTTDVLPILW